VSNVVSNPPIPAPSGRVRSGDRWRRWWSIGWKVGVVLLIAWGLLRPWYAYLRWKNQVRREIEQLNGLAMCPRMNIPGLGEIETGPLNGVYFLGPQVNDENLKVLQKVPDLSVLTLTNTRVTDEGLAQLGRFAQLYGLYIGNVHYDKLIRPAGAKFNTVPLITGKGLAMLKDLPNLQVIQLLGPQTTDADAGALRELKHLTLVELVNSSVTEAGVAELKNALPNCQVRRR
jgi:hypothetical protein